MEHITVITRRKLHTMLEEEEKAHGFYIVPKGERDFDGRLYSIWEDERTRKLYGVPEVRTVHMGFNANEDGKVEAFVEIVEREGACKASWGVTGRTMHSILAFKLAKELPQYEWEITGNYGCTAKKK